MDSVIQKQRRTAEKPFLFTTANGSFIEGVSNNDNNNSGGGGGGGLESQPIHGRGSSFMTTSSSNKNKPINEGYVIWERQRNAWRNLPVKGEEGEGGEKNAKKLSSAFSITKRKRGQRSAIPQDATYEDLLLIPFVKFPKPIKLGEMIDFLVETWSEENNFW